jgi:hypothetical protein
MRRMTAGTSHSFYQRSQLVGWDTNSSRAMGLPVAPLLSAIFWATDTHTVVINRTFF